MPPNPPDPAQYPSYPEVARFLTVLDFDGQGEDGNFAFQTFDESGSQDDSLLTTRYGSLRSHFAELARLNMAGAGIHLGVHETDGLGRTEENILRPRAVFLDFDGCEAPRGIGAIPVSAVVRSVRGPHVYWMLEPGEDLSEWRRVQKAMAARFGGDESATTLTQTMRVPGFFHRKAEAVPVYVEMVEARRYRLSDFVRSFALQPELAALAAAEAVLAERKKGMQSLAPSRPIGDYRGRSERALAFISGVSGVSSHRNDHIASHIAPIGWSFGIEEPEWADECCRWNDQNCSPPLREKEVRQTVASMYRKVAKSEPFGWRLEQDSPEWKAKQDKRRTDERERQEREDAIWAATTSQEPPPSFDEQWADVPHPGQSTKRPTRRAGAATAREASVSLGPHPAVDLLDLSAFNYHATPPVPDGHPLTLRGNSARFIDTYADQARYSPLLKDWYLWDGKRWKKDETGGVFCLAQRVVASIHDLMLHEDVKADKRDSKEEAARKLTVRDMVRKHVAKHETPKGVKDLMEYASWQREVVVAPDQLDADDLLFNCQNGVLDMRTLELKQHDPALYQTKISPTAYVPTAKCPLWMDFLDWCMQGDTAMIEFLQRAAGYSLTGSVAEQAFFVNFGTGGNGKSTFINTIMELGAGYARQCSFDMFLASASRTGGSPNEELLALKDVRMAFASEPDEGARLKEDLIKQITGGERISARPLWGKPIEFFPKFSLWFSCNHRPAIRGTDNGIWRRVLFVPWLANIEDTPDKKDTNFPQKLIPEYEGILAWAMAGAHEWCKNGLQVPASIRAATKGYRDDMDALGDFLAVKTIRAPKATTGSTELYRAYCAWCDSTNEKQWKQKTFSQRIRERGFHTKKTRSGNVFLGIGLISDMSDDDQPRGQQDLGDFDYDDSDSGSRRDGRD
jgi:P4 family phage/plasmid primase-like protien